MFSYDESNSLMIIRQRIMTLQESEIRKLVVPYQTVRNIIKDVMTVVKEPVSIKVLIDLCKDIRTYSKECGETISSESGISTFFSVRLSSMIVIIPI